MKLIHKLKDKYIKGRIKDYLIYVEIQKKLSQKENKKNKIKQVLKRIVLALVALLCPFIYYNLKILAESQKIVLKELCVELNMGYLGFYKNDNGEYLIKYKHEGNNIKSIAEKKLNTINQNCKGDK